jgi:hypothetical protein
MAADLANYMKRDGVKNLMDLPVPFHLGGHKAYNDFAKKQLENLKNKGILNAGSIEVLQGNLKGMINEGIENFHKTGENLNTYFKQF